MKSSEIREKFLRFFEERGHLIAPSDSLVPDDPTLLFTSAGMVQFKPFFLGERVPPRTRIATCQKCLRTGDLEVVGTTPFHHTFFEMLGNFSFGDYFKEEAITWAWEFVTKVLGLDPDKLWASVYIHDDEAYEIWHKKIGLSENRIVRLGEKTNYWPANAPSEGPNGPCGPCSEIFVDFGPKVGCGRSTCNPACDCGRFSEVWNLVFTQYNREDGGVLTPLPKKNIDTGAGLERLAAVLQGTETNFETDLFLPIIQEASSIAGVQYGENDDADIALRVIADHSRAITFCISDGVMPSNVGRGYVLRRIIRRAMLKGRSLGLEEPFLDRLVPVVVSIMEEPYPELREREAHICRTVRAEEEKFLRTLDMGLQKLEESISRLVSAGTTEFPGMEAFVLYDTYGFPIELTQEIAAEHGLTVDMQAFDDAMEEQRRRAREGSDIADAVFVGTLGALAEIEKSSPATEFVGYQSLSCSAKVVGILKNGELTDLARADQRVDIVLDKTPFYPEGGGQVPDIGVITSDTAEFQVENTQRVGSLIVHSGKVVSGELSVGSEVLASVDKALRWSTMRNHTATHLLHKALRMMLGDHVVQAGSLVEPSRLRFDFTHPVAVTPGELIEVEKIVNEEILADDPVEAYETTLEQAKADGAMALFSEKYGGTVRVIKIGNFSKELCGGTHVSRTSQIGFFKILSESSVGAGLRRIEAVTGTAAYEYVRERERLLSEVAEMLKTTPSQIPEAVNRLLDSLRVAEHQIEELQKKSAASKADELIGMASKIGDINFIGARVDTSDMDVLSSLADALADRLGTAVIVLGASADNKALFVSKVTPDLVKRGFHAGNIIREVAKVAGGGGGGKPDFAQAGGRDISKLDDAIAKARELIEHQIGIS
jgi:alanyl-tRNA synthetase